jgi:chromosome partitioning protein
MRIRRRDRDPAEAAESGEPTSGPYDYDQEGSRAADPVTSLITDPEPDEQPRADSESSSPSEVVASPPVAATSAATTEPVTEEPALDEQPATTEATPPAAEDPEPAAAHPGADPEPAVASGPSSAPPAPPTAPPDLPAPTTSQPEAATPEPEVAAVSPGPKHAMRTPSVGDEATSLLNGSKPAPRDLPRIIAIANQKGGVGKTTTTVNLGAALAELDYRVLVIDLDHQGNATTGLGVEARNFELSMYDVIMRDQPLEDCIEPTSVKNLFVAPATIDLAGVEIELVPAFSRELKLKRAIDTVVDDFDFVLIDCPPSLGLITVNGLAAADEVLVPIQCEYYALEGLSQLLRNVNLVSTNLNQTLEVSTIVLTMFDARTRLSVDVANEVREHFSERVCRAVIPRTVRLSEAPSFGQPITVFDPASRGAVAYRELAKEVSNGAPQRSR